MSNSGIWHQILAAVAASLTLFCAGIHYTWPITETLQTELEAFGEGSSVWVDRLPWNAFPLSIGCICGLLPSILAVNRFGRRTTLLVATIPLLVSYVLIVFAEKFLWYAVVRFIGGVGSGAAFVVTPMYIGEIADRRIRGGLCVLIPVMFESGLLLSGVMITWVSLAALAVLGAIVSIVSAIGLLLATESPYYFAIKNLPNEVQKSVATLRGTSEVVPEVEQIQSSTALNQGKVTNFLNSFRVSGILKALFVTIGLFFCRGLSYSARSMIVLVLLSGNETYREYYITVSFITQVSSIAISILVIFLADKLGRRPLLIASALLSTIISLAAVLYYLLLVNGIYFGTMWLLPITISAGYSISISIGIGTLPFVLAGEIFSIKVKTLAFGITFFVHFAVVELGVLILSLFIQYTIQAAVIYLPVLINVVSGVFIYFAVPETKGRSLNEIQTALQGHFSRHV